jgi:hypothetical protein
MLRNPLRTIYLRLSNRVATSLSGTSQVGLNAFNWDLRADLPLSRGKNTRLGLKMCRLLAPRLDAKSRTAIIDADARPEAEKPLIALL